MRTQIIFKTSNVALLWILAIVATSAPITAKAQQRIVYRSAPVAAPAPSAVAWRTASVGDPYGFTNWLNGVRASHGLSAVSYDSNLSSWASVNNSHQQSRGIGHFVMGPARRQNSAMGGYGSIGNMWLSSPAHRAALLDPSIRRIGIAGAGNYWTFNAN